MGDKVYYIDKNDVKRECTVLYDATSEYGVQIITADVVEDTVTLGSSDFNTSRDSYNNAITTLNAKAENYLNTVYASDARCVGSIPDNKNAQSGGYSRADIWFIPYSNMFINTDNNYKTDYNQISENKLDITETGKTYWLASHYVEINSDSNSFRIRSISNNELSDTSVCYVSADSSTRTEKVKHLIFVQYSL